MKTLRHIAQGYLRNWFLPCLGVAVLLFTHRPLGLVIGSLLLFAPIPWVYGYVTGRMEQAKEILHILQR